MVVLKSGVNENGITEYYLAGLDNYDDFDIVIDQVKRLKVNVIDSLDGIYSRMATLEGEDISFKLIYHEDVGVYLFVLSGDITDASMKLKRVLEKVVDNINAAMRS